MNEYHEEVEGAEVSGSAVAHSAMAAAFEKEARHDFSNYQRAVRRVSDVVAGYMGGSSYDELMGFNPEAVLTEKQYERMEAAWEEVQSRLHKMGGGS